MLKELILTGAAATRVHLRAAGLLAVLVTASSIAYAQSVSLGGDTNVLSLEGAAENATVAPGDSTRLAVKATIDPKYHIQSHTPTEDWIIATELKVEAPEGVTVTNVSYPEPEMMSFAFAEGKELSVFGKDPVFLADVKVDTSAEKKEVVLKATLSYQACDDLQCLPPEEKMVEIGFTIGEKTSEAEGSDLFATGATAGSSSPDGGGTFADLARKGWLALLAAVFIGGLGLSLTPCVFPLIPVTLGYFQGQASGSRARTTALALIYVAGIATTYSTLGVAAAFTGSLFGGWLSNPWVLGVLAAIIAIMGLSMFGLFELRPPSFIASKSGGRQGLAGAFVMGLVFGVVAAPCTGPVTVGLLAFVGALASPLLGFALFFVLALGISTPILLLAIFSASLPRSGVWMEWVKKLMGALMFGVAIWLLYPVLGPRGSAWAGGAVAIVMGLWLGFLERSGFRPPALGAVRVIVGIAAVAGGILLLLPRAERPEIVWQPYSAEQVSRARSEGRPVIIDFSADWCAPCRELEAGAFRHPEAVAASEQFVRLKADVTDSRSERVRKLNKEYSVRGVPTIVFIDPDGKEIGDARVLHNIPGEELVSRMRMALGESASRQQ